MGKRQLPYYAQNRDLKMQSPPSPIDFGFWKKDYPGVGLVDYAVANPPYVAINFGLPILDFGGEGRSPKHRRDFLAGRLKPTLAQWWGKAIAIWERDRPRVDRVGCISVTKWSVMHHLIIRVWDWWITLSLFFDVPWGYIHPTWLRGVWVWWEGRSL